MPASSSSVSKTAPVASEALKRIAALNAIEANIRGQPPPRHAAVRQDQARPLLNELEHWLHSQLPFFVVGEHLLHSEPHVRDVGASFSGGPGTGQVGCPKAGSDR